MIYDPRQSPASDMQTIDAMALNIDIAPTMLDYAGVAIPETVQGQSFAALLTDPQAEWRDAFLYTYFWERSFAQTPTVLGIRTDRYKFMQYHGIFDLYELYDINEDPHETNNLLGDIRVTTEAGTLDGLINRGDFDPELKETFRTVHRRLMEELDRLGCAREPNWRP